MAAFRLALEQGADGIELDVHATRDGTVVVHHDERLPVVDASGVATWLPIVQADAATVRSTRLRGGGEVPTLDAVLDFVGTLATVYIEVKAAGIEDALLACLDRHPGARVAVHAFDHRIPVAMRARRIGLSTGVLSTSYPLDLAGFIGQARPAAFWEYAPLIDDALVRQAHALGARVVAWTVNDPVHARLLHTMGVDALCTDTPGLLRETFASR